MDEESPWIFGFNPDPIFNPEPIQGKVQIEFINNRLKIVDCLRIIQTSDGRPIYLEDTDNILYNFMVILSIRKV